MARRTRLPSFIKATSGELLKKRAHVTLGRRVQYLHTFVLGKVPSGSLNSSWKTSVYSEPGVSASAGNGSTPSANLPPCANDTMENNAIVSTASNLLLFFFCDMLLLRFYLKRYDQKSIESSYSTDENIRNLT